MITDNNNKIYSINKYNDNIFEWKIEINEKHPLIMDFRNPPIYDLSRITYIEKTNVNLTDFIEKRSYLNLDEKIISICDKIELFLLDVYKSFQVPNKGKCCGLCLCNIF